MMNTIRDAINAGAKQVYCNNGTVIDLPDVGFKKCYQYFPPKMIQGKPVYRWVFCSIKGNPEELSHRKLNRNGISYFREDDYLVKEKEINMFIMDNGGIDEYTTDYWATGWMYY